MVRALVQAERDRRNRIRRYDWRGALCPFLSEHGPGGYLQDRCTHARPNQVMPPGDWRLWLAKAGRGWGKTRVGAEAVREWSERYPRIGMIAPTKDDARDIMVEGESGILAVFPPDRPARYVGNRRRVEFPSGAIGTIYTADEPERLRGPQHHKLWMDEIASWRYLEDAFDMAMLGLRLGDNPQAVLTSTPKNVKLLRQLRDRSRLADDPLGRVIMTEGATYENKANLATAFITELVQKYEGTRLGRQELYAEILEDVEGSLWTRNLITYANPPTIVRHGEVVPDFLRIVVAIDPAVTSGEDSDETGIVVAGISAQDGRVFVLEDLSGRMGALEWAKRAIIAYRDLGADRIVAEANNGGDLVEVTLRQIDPNVPVRLVHASRGKRTRAEPIAALYEQGKVVHARAFDLLEDQMCTYTGRTGEDSPDRMDALVWAITELQVTGSMTGASDVSIA